MTHTNKPARTTSLRLRQEIDLIGVDGLVVEDVKPTLAM
jgi:hypothetical protein